MDKTIWQTALTDTPLTDKFLDAGRLRAVGNSVYRFVLNGTGAIITLGDVLFFGTSDLTKGTVYTYGQSTVGTTVNSMAGVAMATCAIGSYLWIQVLGPNASINTLGAAAVAAVNEVITIAFTTAPTTGGSYFIQVGNKATASLAYNASTATVQTALDAAFGSANAIVCTGDGLTGTNKNLILTFSGTGYAGRPITENVNFIPLLSMSVIAATAPIITRTTAGVLAVTGTAVGDILVGVSAQAYLTKGSSVGVSAGVSNHVLADVAYATATPALKAGTIKCLQ